MRRRIYRHRIAHHPTAASGTGNGESVTVKSSGDRPETQPGTRRGLTKKQAEAALRGLIHEVRQAPPEERLTFADVGERYVHHVEHVLKRRPTTVADYRSILRRHLGPYFGQAGIERITAGDMASYMAAMSAKGLETKTISNHLNLAHGVFAFAVKRGWAERNPVASVDRPRVWGPSRTFTTSIAPTWRRSCGPSPMTSAARPTARSISPPRWPGSGKGSWSRCGGETWIGSRG